MNRSESFRTFISAFRQFKRLLFRIEELATQIEPAYVARLRTASEWAHVDDRPRWLRPVGGFAIIFLLLLTRCFHWMVQPQFYIEDGPEFYAKAFNQGAGTLYESYMGYFHVVPRAAALLASQWPPAAGPLLLELVATAIQALTACYLLSSRLQSAIGSIRVRALLALFVVGYPYSNELFANVAHSQWYLDLLAVSILCADPPSSVWSRWFERLALLAASLSGPLAPILCALAWWKTRNGGRTRLDAALLTCSAVAVVVSIVTHPRLGVHGHPRFSLLERMISNQLVIGPTLGFREVVRTPFEPYFSWAEFSYALFWLLVTAYGVARGPNWFRAVFLIGSFSFASCLYSGGNWTMLGSGGVAERYFFFLGLLFICSCALAAHSFRPVSLRWAFRAVLLCTFVGCAWNWIYDPPFARFNYGPQIRGFSELKPGESLQISIPIDRKSDRANWSMKLIRR